MAWSWRDILKGFGFKVGDKGQRRPTMAPVSFNLGLDFGTRFTKVCYRDVASERSGIITFGAKPGKWQNAMVPSMVRIHQDGRLVVPWSKNADSRASKNARTVDYPKLRLASCDSTFRDPAWKLDTLPGQDGIDIEAVCAFFISRVLIEAKSHVTKRETERIKGREVLWSANIGVPVEYCNSASIDRFRRVLAAAWLISTREKAAREMLFDQMKAEYQTLLSDPEIDDVDCHATPEIAAAVVSFITSRQAREGMYVYFDIGGGTVDGVSFRYWRNQGEPRVSFYTGKVELLGVNALDAMERTCTGRCIEELLLCYPCSQALPPLDEGKRLICRQVGHVIMTTKRVEQHAWRPNGYRACEATYLRPVAVDAPVCIFIGGGGGGSGFYQDTILSTYDRNRLRNANIPPFAVARLPVPEDLDFNDMPREEFRRFAVAYGLSVPVGEFPVFHLPDEVGGPDQPPEPQRPVVVPYEDTKDVYD